MNFFPLCTAMVCPIISGTIVERRDHVLITFFSLRVFSPSTLTRRWPSTNGPFLSERAIDSLFLHSPQAAPWCPPHLLESSYRPRNAVRLRAERANKPRALRIRNPFHDDRPARFAQLVQHRFWRSHCYLDQWTYRLRALRGYALGGGFSRALQQPAASCCGSCCACCSHCFCSHRAVLPSPPGLPPQLTFRSYFLRSTMCLSVRLLFRVFLPNVGKAHGVCG